MKENKTIPPPPEKPEPYDCCGSGCMPCVFDHYYTALEEWQEKYEAAFNEEAKKTNPSTTQSPVGSDDSTT